MYKFETLLSKIDCIQHTVYKFLKHTRVYNGPCTFKELYIFFSPNLNDLYFSIKQSSTLLMLWEDTFLKIDSWKLLNEKFDRSDSPVCIGREGFLHFSFYTHNIKIFIITKYQENMIVYMNFFITLQSFQNQTISWPKMSWILRSS